MKKHVFILIAFISQFSFSQISPIDTSGCAPLTSVNFTHATADVWDFGDGTSGTGNSVTHSYGQPGNYTVTVSSGGSIVSQTTVTVFGNPTPAFNLGGDAAGCVPLNTSFNDASTGGGGTAITKWNWTFGDGGASTNQNPTYNYTLVGTFSVSLIVTDANGCDSSVTKKDLISVTNSPTASFTTTPNPASACTGPLTVSFNNSSLNSTGGTSNITYAWDFGNGQTSTDKDPAAVTYTTEGSYVVSLTVTEAGGCSRVTTRTVTIGAPQALPNVSDTICLNAGVILGNNSVGASSYKWEFTGGPTYNSKNPFHTFSSAGSQEIKLTATSGQGCADDTTFTVFVEEVVVEAISVPTYKCEEPYCFDFTANATNTNVASYNWSFSVLDKKSGQNVQHCYSVNDTLYYVHDPYYKNISLNVATTNGCTANKVLTDTIFPVSAFFVPDTSMGCAPFTVNFSDSTRSRENIVSWEYIFGDGSTSTDTNPTHTFNSAGEYEVVLIATNSFGCKDTSFPVTILVGSPLALDFSITPASICVGDSVTFDDLSANPNIDYWHYETNSNKSSSCINSPTQSIANMDEVGFQDVTMHANYNGCISTVTKVGALEVKGPVGDLRYTGICASPLDYTFIGQIQGATSWDWDFGDGTTALNSTDSTVTHSYAATGNYTVKLITKNNVTGCANDTQSVSIQVREIKAVITGDSVLCGAKTYSYSGANSQGVISITEDCGNTYHWDTGEKTVPRTRTNPDIEFSFTGTGSRTIRLIVADVNGCRDTTEKEIKISNITAKIGLDKNKGCLPLLIAMSDSSVSDTSIVDWTWNVNGILHSNAKDTNVTFVNNATQTIQLIVRDSLGCIDSAQTLVTPITPVATFSATTDRTICAGDSVTFRPVINAAGVDSVKWTFGNVLGTSKTYSPKFTFAAGGSYDVTLQVFDTSGCSNTSTINNYVTVQDYPVIDFTFKDVENKDTLFCYDNQLTYTATATGSNLTYNWDLKNGAATINSAVVSGSYPDQNPGVYDVQLDVTTTFGCKTTLTKSVELVGPVADFDMDKTLICSGDVVTFEIKDSLAVSSYLWDFGDGTDTSNISPIAHAYNNVPLSLKTAAQLIVRGKGDVCPKAYSKELNFQKVAARFDLSDTTLCMNEGLSISDQSLGADSYQWSITNNGSYSSATVPSILFNTSGTQTIELVVKNNAISCTDTLRKELIVHALPSISTSDKRFCDGDVVTLTASASGNKISHVWTPSDLVTNKFNLSTDANPTETTDFTITVSDTNVVASDTSICVNSAISNVYIQKQFDPKTVDTCVVIGEKVPLGRDLGEAYTYSWEGSEADKEWLSCTDCPVQEIMVTEPVENVYYTLLYEDTMGCFTNEIFYNVCILESYTFDVPSAFTPDGDGINDIVYLRGHGIKKVIDFKIFNRWGELIFETNDIHQGWDGTYKTRDQGMETFVYKATVEFYNGETESKGGSLTLIK